MTSARNVPARLERHALLVYFSALGVEALLNAYAYPNDSSHCANYESFDYTQDVGSHIEVEEENPPTRVNVTCRVCDAVIELDGRPSQHVVKCPHCQEATPIKPAPLDTYAVHATACLYVELHRLELLALATIAGLAIRAPAGSCRVTCAYCQEMFLFNTLNNSLATCPHCKRCSSVGSRFARTRAFLYLTGTILVLLICVLLYLFTKSAAASFFPLYFLYIAIAIVALLLLKRLPFSVNNLRRRAIHYFMIKASTVVGPV